MIMHACICTIESGVVTATCPVCGWWEKRDAKTGTRLEYSGWSPIQHDRTTGGLTMDIDAMSAMDAWINGIEDKLIKGE